jgi:hypothetical protein
MNSELLTLKAFKRVPALDLMIDPLVQGLRHDSRYNSVLAKVGLARRS